MSQSGNTVKRTISLTPEVNSLLVDEKNVSGLISNLLEEHFSNLDLATRSGFVKILKHLSERIDNLESSLEVTLSKSNEILDNIRERM